MSHVLTLVSNPALPALDGAHLERAGAHLPQAGAPAWLARGVAADIPFTPADAGLDALRAETLAVLDGAPIDIVMQPLAFRRKRLLVADMDSTMIEQEGIDELADVLGLKAEVAAITERAMRGELSFEPALRSRIALLKGLPRDAVRQVIATRLTLTPGACALVRTMRAHGASTVLVSGGFTLFSAEIARRIGFDEHRANTLLFDGGDRLTGEVAEPILGREAKLDALKAFRRRLRLDPMETLAVGDGANDLAMIREAGLGVAYHAKPNVAAAADARIDHADLTALLYAQGYRREDFVA